jgi:hypothetical protein
MRDLDQLLANLTDAVSYSYLEDATRPGVLVSRLKDGQVYCSVVRYGSKFSRGKHVVCKCTGPDLSTAVATLANDFLAVALSAPPVKNPLEVLKETLDLD